MRSTVTGTVMQATNEEWLKFVEEVKKGEWDFLEAHTPMGDGIERVEYGAFNDPYFWEPLYASGELSESLRNLVDDPMEAGLSLWQVHKWIETANEARATDQAKVDKYGLIIPKKRMVIEFPWEPVTIEEIETERKGRI